MKIIILYNLLDTYKNDLEELDENIQESLAAAYELDQEGTTIQDLDLAHKHLLHGIQLTKDLQEFLGSQSLTKKAIKHLPGRS